jgi:hypothetical protein
LFGRSPQAGLSPPQAHLSFDSLAGAHGLAQPAGGPGGWLGDCLAGRGSGRARRAPPRAELATAGTGGGRGPGRPGGGGKGSTGRREFSVACGGERGAWLASPGAHPDPCLLAVTDGASVAVLSYRPQPPPGAGGCAAPAAPAPVSAKRLQLAPLALPQDGPSQQASPSDGRGGGGSFELTPALAAGGASGGHPVPQAHAPEQAQAGGHGRGPGEGALLRLVQSHGTASGLAAAAADAAVASGGLPSAWPQPERTSAGALRSRTLPSRQGTAFERASGHTSTQSAVADALLAQWRAAASGHAGVLPGSPYLGPLSRSSSLASSVLVLGLPPLGLHLQLQAGGLPRVAAAAAAASAGAEGDGVPFRSSRGR